MAAGPLLTVGIALLSLIATDAAAQQNVPGYSVLYSFLAGWTAHPLSGLIRDEEGNLYRTSNGGGAYGNGVVFELDQFGKQTVLHAFSGGAMGRSLRRRN